MGKIFNKGLDKDDEKEGLLKILKNIKDKSEEQLQAIKDQGKEQLKEFKNIGKNKTLKAVDEISKQKKNNEANKLLAEFEKIDKRLDKAELVCTKTDETKYNFNIFAIPLKFILKNHNYEITLDEAIEEQAELKELINKLNDYGPRISKKNRREKQSFRICKKIV